LAAAAVAVILALAWAGARYGGRRAPGKNQGPNLLLLASDSIRPDRLSCAGYGRDTTPALDRLAGQGVFFNNAYVSLARTFPSWVSLLTGQYPFHHGVTTMFPSVGDRQKELHALPAILSAHGWTTSVVSDYAGDIFPRIELGFERVEAPGFNLTSLAQVRGLEIHTHLLPYLVNPWGRKLMPVLKEFATLGDPRFVERDVIKELSRLRGKDRFFLAVFMSCTHFPYSPPWPYYRTYTDNKYRGLSKYNKINRITVEEEISPADVEQINGLFDGAIRATDDSIAGILQALQSSGLAHTTIVVFLSDHGENLYESDYLMGHGDHLRGSYSLKFPLIIFDPRRPGKGKIIPSRVRQVDLFPTLLELLGVPLPACQPELPPGFKPVSLLPMMEGTEEPSDLPVYAETGLWFVSQGPGRFQRERIIYPDVTVVCGLEEFFNQEIVRKDEWAELTELAKHRMLMDGPWKLLYLPLPAGVRWELYHLESDPEELHDLASTRPQDLSRLQAQLFAFLSTRPGWTVAGEWFLPDPEKQP
jgi:arylsulfatase A-like enzyme